MKKIAAYYGVDLRAQRQYYGDLFDCKQSVPLLIHSKLIYIPVKTRLPRVPDDGAFAYVNYFAVKSVRDADSSADISFKSTLNLIKDITLHCLYKPEVIKKRMHIASNINEEHSRKLGLDVDYEPKRNKEKNIRIVLEVNADLQDALLDVIYDDDEEYNDET